MSSMSSDGKIVAPQDVKIHIDAATQTVTFEQKTSHFAIKPDKVTVPLVCIEALYVTLVTQSLKERGINVGQQHMNVAAPQKRATVSA